MQATPYKFQAIAVEKRALGMLITPQRNRTIRVISKGKFIVTITKGSTYIDIRRYWKPKEEVVPRKKGLCLRSLEYSAIKELVPEIGRA